MRSPVLLLVCCAVTALSLTEDAKETKDSATVVPANAFVSNSSISPNTTLVPPMNTTTVAPPKNTTTVAPPKNTTTVAPPKNTTTVAPPKNTTTVAPPKNTTTVAPPTNTTTVKPSTTTPSPPGPTPPTNLTTGEYILKKDDVTCLMAVMALQIRLQTPKANGTFVIQKNKTTTAGGCEDTRANLTIVFDQGFITFLFNKSVESNDVYVHALSFNLAYPLSKGGNGHYHVSNKSVHLFAARVAHSYSCRDESLYMGDGLYLDVKDDTMQVFNLTNANKFGSPDRCPADQSDYRLAIGVGVTLLVLIVVVVVVYLLGRKKRGDGYQSL